MTLLPLIKNAPSSKNSFSSPWFSVPFLFNNFLTNLATRAFLWEEREKKPLFSLYSYKEALWQGLLTLIMMHCLKIVFPLLDLVCTFWSIVFWPTSPPGLFYKRKEKRSPYFLFTLIKNPWGKAFWPWLWCAVSK